MTLFSFKFLSRYPQKLYRNKLFIKIPRIASLRFRIKSILKPSSIRIRYDNTIIHQEELTNSDACQIYRDEKYFNIWINLLCCDCEEIRLIIECKFVGFYVPIKSINCILISNELSNKYINSDSYILPSLISTVHCQGEDLVKEILSLPSVIRSTSNDPIINKIQSIALLRLDQLGDFILSIPAIHELKLLFPYAKITIFLAQVNEEIARSTGFFDEIITVPFGFKENSNDRKMNDATISIARNANKSKYFDVAIDLSPMIESREFLDVISAELKFGYENTSASFTDVGLLIHAKDPINMLSNVNHATYCFILMDAVKRILKPKTIHLAPRQTSSSILNSLKLPPKKYITLHTGSRNKLVRWDLNNYISLCNFLTDMNYNVVIILDDQIPIYQKNSLNNQDLIRIIDYKLEFNEFDAIISNSLLFIGNDSGPKHLAALRSIDVISIHSSRANWTEWGQVDSGIVITKRVPCAGCHIVNEFECGRRLACIKNIDPNQVADIVEKKLITMV